MPTNFDDQLPTHLTKPTASYLSWLVPASALCLSLPLAARAQSTAAFPAKTELAGAAASTATPENYRLSANDLVYVKVFEEDDLNSTLRLGASTGGGWAFDVVNVVPEPSSTVAIGAGALGLFWVLRLRKNARVSRS